MARAQSWRLDCAMRVPEYHHGTGCAWAGEEMGAQEGWKRSKARNGLLEVRSFPTLSLETRAHPVMQGPPSLERQGN